MYKEKSPINIFTSIDEEYFRVTPVSQLTTQSKSAHVFACMSTLDKKTHNPDIKQPLLLQYLFLIQQSKVAESWIGLSTDTG